MIKKKIDHSKFFTIHLLLWNEVSNKRLMPWKNEKDPYKIWVSEIILQQTQVKQGLGYYERFIKKFPAVQQLAVAQDEKVFKLWEGLGYYSRCRNLIITSRHITNNLDGKFPNTYNDILLLKGIGPYTAAAIASFAYNLPHAVLDGNVLRVLARFFGIDAGIDTASGKKLFTALSQHLLSKSRPGVYNQAIMDFGATICKPKIPLCPECPLQKNCFAFNHNLVSRLPVKEKSIIRKNRFLNYLIIIFKNNVYVRQRMAKDIWQNLNEFVLVETKEPPQAANVLTSGLITFIKKSSPLKIINVSETMYQQLTHVNVSGIFITIYIKKKIELDGYNLVPYASLFELPFPKFITAYLKDYAVSLNLPFTA